MQFNLFLHAVDVIGPGVNSWEQFCHNQGQIDLEQPVTTPKNQTLPATERRRITPTIKLALACAESTIAQLPFEEQNIASIFASSNGDSEIMYYLGQVLSSDPSCVSPTKFHNSLHNAASGYWSIAQKNMQATSAITAGDFTVATSFIEAALYSSIEQKSVLLVCYDIAAPMGLRNHIAIDTSFAMAFVLSPNEELPHIAKLNLAVNQVKEECTLENSYTQKNPIFAGLPLLQILAGENSNAEVTLPYLPKQNLRIKVKKS